jgi:hypothetical protein
MSPKFIAYVIHVPEKDDYFLGEKQILPGMDQRAWIKLPQLAKRFGRKQAAERVRSRLDVDYRTEVWELWENETQYLTCPCEE